MSNESSNDTPQTSTSAARSVYETFMRPGPLTSTLYSPRQALHRFVPLRDPSNPYAVDNLTRQRLPYFLPWKIGPSPQEPPPDFSFITNSCAGKAIIGTIGGGMMGLLMGVFLGAMSDATPVHTLLPTGHAVPQAPLSEQVRVTMRATADKSIYWCKNFAFLTGIFASSECLVEKYRGKHDVWNAVASGCVTGAALQAHNGPQAAAVGCGGFAAFSLVIDSVMGTH